MIKVSLQEMNVCQLTCLNSWYQIFTTVAALWLNLISNPAEIQFPLHVGRKVKGLGSVYVNDEPFGNIVCMYNLLGTQFLRTWMCNSIYRGWEMGRSVGAQQQFSAPYGLPNSAMISNCKKQVSQQLKSADIRNKEQFMCT